MIGRLHHVVLDCPDSTLLAEFYSKLLGHPVTYRNADFCVVATNDATSGLAFQRSSDFRTPTWPAGEVLQHIHLDVMVDDLRAAGLAVAALGARPLGPQGVYADPVGHPFCLIERPTWAEAIGDQ